MPATLEVESTLTDRYQTTIPETVRRALKLGKRDKIHYAIRPDGDVLLSRVPEVVEEDPLLGHFLSFLAHDMAAHPERVHLMDSALVQRIQSLVGAIEVELGAPLSAEDE